MKKTTYQVNSKMMPVANLKQAAMLKKYGIGKPSDFETEHFKRFGLTNHLKGVVVTVTGLVLCNWELVQIAKAAKVKEIEVVVIEGLLDDEIMQVVAVSNVRKRISKKALAELIIDIRDYLTKNEIGIAWAIDVPGESTDAKIGTLIGYSYGMVNGYQKIYKHHPEFLGMMDKEELCYTEAMKRIKDESNSKESETCSPGDGGPVVPIALKAPKNNYAGEANMVPCEPMESIQIRYSNGRTVDILIDGTKGVGSLFDKNIEVSYSAKMETCQGGAEFHRLDSSIYNLEFVLRKAA